MAVNPVNAHRGRHALFLGMTGSGKSCLIRQKLQAHKKIFSRVLIWDTNGEHDATYTGTRAGWLRELQVLVSNPGTVYTRLAYCPAVPTPEEWQWWCRTVWAVLDGKCTTLVVAEELAAVCKSTGKEQDAAGVLINQGRKYGLVFWGTSQRPQEIAKTYYDNAALLFAGQQRGAAMQRKMAAEVGVAPTDIAELKPLEFWVREPGKQPLKMKATFTA